MLILEKTGDQLFVKSSRLYCLNACMVRMVQMALRVYRLPILHLEQAHHRRCLPFKVLQNTSRRKMSQRSRMAMQRVATHPSNFLH